MGKDKTGKPFERRVADAYREMGAWKVEHNVRLAGNQIDVYVELVTPVRLLHRIAVEAKDWSSTVGIDIVNDFAKIVNLLRGERLIDDGVIVSAVGFSREARDAASTYGIQLLEPADLDRMVAEAKAAGRTKPTATPIPLPPQAYFAHTYPLQENFTGRLSERKMLTEWFENDNKPVLAMIALGGMGKSALTWIWVQQDVLGFSLPGVTEGSPVAEDARPQGLLWWSFYEREAQFSTFLNEALAYVGGGSMNLASIPSDREKVRALVNILQQRRFLLVLDGLERELCAYASLSAAYQGDKFVEDERGDFRSCTSSHAADFLSSVAALPLQSRVLIISRLFPRELEGLNGCRQEELKKMDPEDGVTFFHLQGVKGTRAEIQDVCEPYGYNPLALRLLAGLIAKDMRSPGDIQVAGRYPVLPELKGKEQHHILQVAYDTLDEDERGLLSRIAAFRSPMTYEAVSIFSTYKSEKEFDAALEELTNRGLLFFDRGQKRFDLHPIVRQYSYERLGDKKGIHTRLRDYFSAKPTPDRDKVQSVEDLNPVIELYHQTVGAGGFDDAAALFRDRLKPPLYFRFGAYHTCIELLRALFPDGEDRPPLLKEESARAWTLNELANSYCLSGQPRRAVRLFEMSNVIDKQKGDAAIGLGNLAYMAQIPLGELAAAEQNLTRSIELCREIGDEPREAVGHQELGRLLVYQGIFDDASKELDASTRHCRQTNDNQGICIDESWRALRALLMGDAKAALEAARNALVYWKKDAKEDYPVERDFVRAEWLLGAALVALASEENARRDELLSEAELHLTEALYRCRSRNAKVTETSSGMMELEPDILLAWARWHHVKGNKQEAQDHAEEALSIADRCEYRLKQADIHNFLARLDLEAGKKKDAIRHAQTAHERAWCDGPPHCYKPALDEARRLLKELGATARQ
ncbi:MAG: hypothetical protein GTN65_11230 [Armatimonadetes bacterium]|nr:hypothetical protein [Armatimonadota bacterium]NIO97640.1 hypothetical protein [Armatimonadota bacterium]